MRAHEIPNCQTYLDNTYGGIEVFKTKISESPKLFRETIERFDKKECENFFNYLGKDWLRDFLQNPSQLKRILKKSPELISKTLLDFLNGDDQWIQKTFNNKEKLALILNSYVEPLDVYQPDPIDYILQKWSLFLSYFTTDWQENFISNEYEFNHFMHKITPADLFEKKPINPDVFLNFISALSQIAPDEEKSVAIEKNLMSKISEKQIHEIMLTDQTFQKTLVALPQHEQKPFFQLRVFAMACAYHYELTQHKPRLSIPFIGYSYQDKLSGAKSLIDSMLNDQKPNASLAQLNSGELGVLNKLYKPSEARLLIKLEQWAGKKPLITG